MRDEENSDTSQTFAEQTVVFLVFAGRLNALRVHNFLGCLSAFLCFSEWFSDDLLQLLFRERKKK